MTGAVHGLALAVSHTVGGELIWKENIASILLELLYIQVSACNM